MSNGDIIIIAILFVGLFIVSFVWMCILSNESAENAERIEQTDKKYYQLAEFFNIHGCDIDELQKVCTSLIAQNKEQAEQINKLVKKVKKLEKEKKQ